MRNGRVGKFIVRTKSPESTEVSGKMSALEKIAWMKEHNPRARLIPYSATYYNAVSELNTQVRGTLVRPPVPDWFCGHVNDDGWPWLDDMANGLGGNDAAIPMAKRRAEDDMSDYPWDKCCEYGMEPNTPAYMWCEEPALYAQNEDETFLSDFTIDTVYEDATFPETEAGFAGVDCTTNEELPKKSGEWSCGGWSGGQIGKANVNINSATISGRSKVAWNYSKGASVVDGWGVNRALICLGLLYSGNWYSGKIDWVKPGQTHKDLKNVKCGYNGWTAGILEKATKAKVCVCNSSTKACSNWYEFTL